MDPLAFLNLLQKLIAEVIYQYDRMLRPVGSEHSSGNCQSIRFLAE